MRVSVQANLVTGIPYFGHLRGKREDAVRWHEPGRFDSLSLEEFKEPVGADGGTEYTARHVAGVRSQTSPRVKPSDNEVRQQYTSDDEAIWPTNSHRRRHRCSM